MRKVKRERQQKIHMGSVKPDKNVIRKGLRSHQSHPHNQNLTPNA